jgi:DNA mismatch repair ATPase MutL
VIQGILGDIGEYMFTQTSSAIKFGDTLTLFEMHALLRDATLDYSATCPHGRPVAFEIDLEMLK